MSKKLPRGTIIELGGEPRINFLPPEIQQRKDARRRRRSLFMLVILVAIVCVIGYVYATQFATERQAALEAEQQTTLDLLAQQGQYSEARALAQRVELTESAIAITTADEVFWRDLVNSVTEVFPSGVTMTQWTAIGSSATNPIPASAALMEAPSSLRLEISVATRDMNTLHRLLEELATVPGVTVVGTTGFSSEEGEVLTMISLGFSSDVYAKRFADGWSPTTEQPTAPEPVEETTDDATEGGEE